MSWKNKWRNLINNSKLAGNTCLLSLEEYINLALEAGLVSPDQIGCTPESFQMARYGDKGNYEVGNCRFITMKENLLEKKINGGVQSGADKLRGRTKDDTNYLRSSSERQKGRINQGSEKAAQIKKGTTKYNNPSLAKTADKQSKHYRLVSPSGEIFEGKNLTEFCKQHGLHQGCMSNVIAGRIKHHKGWTGEFI